MNTTAMKYEARKKREAKQATDDANRLRLAMKITGEAGIMLSPQQQAELLRRYVRELDKLIISLSRDFGREAEDAIRGLVIDKQNAIKQIARIYRNEVRPKL